MLNWTLQNVKVRHRQQVQLPWSGTSEAELVWELVWRWMHRSSTNRRHRPGITFPQTKYTHFLPCCLLVYIPLFVIFWQRGGGRWGGADSWRTAAQRRTVSVRIFTPGSRGKGAHDAWSILWSSSCGLASGSRDLGHSRHTVGLRSPQLPAALVWH